jgi:hypothetical protein
MDGPDGIVFGRVITVEQRDALEAVLELSQRRVGNGDREAFALCLAYYLEITPEQARERLEWVVGFMGQVLQRRDPRSR